MICFRDRMRAGEITSGAAVSPTIKCQQAQVHYLDLINNLSTTNAKLRRALAGATATIGGQEARIAILETELVTTRELARERRNRTVKGGWIGEAQVYTQVEVQELERKKREGKEAASKMGRGHGRGRGRGRGAAGGKVHGRGRGQGQNKALDVGPIDDISE
ncbi:hypothetical protein FRC10_000242, partial [Ceratobasidium sp. 414]